MAQKFPATSKFHDIITRINKGGCPTIHQLNSTRETIDTLKRVTVGEKDSGKANKTILLVGETGTGKSSLIDALVNYTMGVKWEDKIWFQIVNEEKSNQTESQTTDVIVYEIFGFEGKTLPYSLTIIDTPGFGDTRNDEQDALVSQRLLDLFRSNCVIHEVDAVGVVLKASVNRLSDRLVYIFNSVMSLFGNDIEKNIVALMTHSDGLTPENALQALQAAKIKCAKNENNEPVYFLFNNCQAKNRTEKEERSLKHYYEISETGMSEFASFLEKTEPQKLEKTVEVINNRIRLTASIHNLQDRIQLINMKQNEIRQTEKSLKEHEQKMKDNENFTVQVDEAYMDKETIDGGKWALFFYEAAVCCTNCEENCHFPGCTIAWSPKHCEVMKNGRCTVCTGRCPVSVHVKEKWIYVNKTRNVQKTSEDIKKKYESSKAGSEEAANILENLQTKKENLEADEMRWLNEAYQCVESLNEIALNVNSLSTYVHLDFLIEKMKEKGETEKARKLEEMSRKADSVDQRGVKYTLGRMWNKIRGNKGERMDSAV